ncbi:Pre-mRNA-splicing factor cef1 [Orbilia oligospora]|uniref:Pre-mRNA-splicing factor cef1 n=1 Tax=Orbilia oligospora TaxID=2813651 RepID=A0A7C8PHD2_ORBOL|nr:Pre-mRNA-splicing factor cef1 [Orbilia oligospora]KAF3175783.1 Pre-mRNA-splicing factor cef1 [Orbilia oligospora]KAF3243118.1 Pre-mRNA-splicing factor cef1 [Orbilia oligospora]KAF3264852.1 Pre-mRNA-splicing factor cef1 [Orbilia oligospora]KAF3294775.1 Pre-mRNA-splicing factor cef1 [Orbilia oligospora]
MPVVKGGVWTNVEDEILKASVSKYGLNQWARVSSLLARKTPKQCKARWLEWLDPGIRKIEWSKEEDEKLLHLAKLMPTQWRTIAPLVGRTATQCLERYQKLLDDAEARENEELGLGGPDGAETLAPTADQVRKLRPGEMDPDPETKPARPDAIDMDEDEKEMLSEARARLANTQGKKAKRKARERQLEASRRLAVLQKRRELKHAGINIKLTNRKKGQMDYNADIPFEKKAAAGFYDTSEEQARNERTLQAFDPRKAVVQSKRKGDQDDDNDPKRRKKGQNADIQAAKKVAQLQRIREAEQMSKRRQLVLPMPQVGDAELEDIVKMGLAGANANKLASSSENESTKGLVGDYTNVINSGMPIRTPRAPPQEDHIANEIRNIRALTETQSSLLGGENTPLHEGKGTTGFEGMTPRRSAIVTPNPMATPMRPGMPGATPLHSGLPGQTPLRTPRDNLAINANGMGGFVSETPREQKMRLTSLKSQLQAGFSNLPKPKEEKWEFEIDDPDAEGEAVTEVIEEDSEERDKRLKAIREAQERLEFARRTQVVQRGLPRPTVLDIDALYEAFSTSGTSPEDLIQNEMSLLIASDALKFPVQGGKVTGVPKPLSEVEDEHVKKARLEILVELPADVLKTMNKTYENGWENAYWSGGLPGLDGYGDDEELDKKNVMKTIFDAVQSNLIKNAEAGNKLEKKLGLTLGGYQKRQQILAQKITEAYSAVLDAKNKLDSFKTLAISEEDAIPRRLDTLRSEVEFVQKREMEAQMMYKTRREELEGLASVNGAA